MLQVSFKNSEMHGHHVGAEKQTLVLCKNDKCASLLRQLSIPKCDFDYMKNRLLMRDLISPSFLLLIFSI